MAQSTLKMFFLSSKFLLTFYILIVTYLCPMAGLAQTNEIPFQPHMLLHSIQGCQPNSMCNEAMGKQRQAWLSLVKQVRTNKLTLLALEDFRKKKGIPFSVWLKGEMQPKDISTTPAADRGKLKSSDKGPVAYWDSPCEFHRKQEEPVHTAQIFLKDLSPKTQAFVTQNFQGKIVFQKAYLFEQKQDKAPLEFVIPRDEFPLYIKPQKLFFLLEEEGLFYHLDIDHAGKMHIMKPENRNPIIPAENIACPDYAVRSLASLMGQNQMIYQVAQCRQYTHLGHNYLLVIPGGCY